MSRPKKDGRRATGIQGKKGYLYIVLSHTIIENGVKKTEKEWIKTGLKDTTENVTKAKERRKRLLNASSFNQPNLNITLKEFTDLMLSKKKRIVTDTTYSGYYYRAKKIKAYFGDIRVRDINERMVENFLDSLFKTDHVQPRTVKDIKVFLGNVIDLAVKEGIIQYNPVKEVSINKNLAAKYAKDKNPDEEFFSYEEAQLFLDKVRDHPLYELFYLTLFFGLRREEALGLRWSAINLKDRTMAINHTVTKGTKITRANTTKTAASARVYPLTDEQVEMFRHLRKKELDDRKLCGNGYFESDYVFKHRDGTLYYPDYPSKAFGKIIRKNPDLPQNITYHGLRGSCVSILVHMNLDIKTIQKWVGHADIDTTMRIYAKVKDKESKMEVSDTMKNTLGLKNYSSSETTD